MHAMSRRQAGRVPSSSRCLSSRWKVGRGSFLSPAPITALLLAYLLAMMDQPFSQSSSDHSVYHSPLPSMGLQHQKASLLCCAE